MKIDRLYIGDFGIFKNAVMDGIGKDIVLVGGVNRAGKSTLMEVLRCLPFGIQKSSAIPPANTEYFLESDMVSVNGQKINVKIRGYGEPKLYGNFDFSSVAYNNIYNIDRYTYEEIYTISLNELNNILSGDARLQAVLLGAGFKKAVLLPEVIKEFSKEAERLGGKKGNPSTKMFKSYSSIISSALKDKEKALSQSEEYTKKQKAFNKVMEETESLKEELDMTDNSVIVLDVLKESYEDIKRFKEIEDKGMNEKKQKDINYDKMEPAEAVRLKDKYMTLLKEYSDNANIFKRTVNFNLDFKDRLIENENAIKKLAAEASGFKEKLRMYDMESYKLEEEKKSIIADIHKVNEKFSGSFKEIMDIKCDNLEIGELNKLYSDLRENEHAISEKKNKSAAVKAQIEIYEEKSKDIKYKNNSTLYFINSILICLLAGNAIAVAYQGFHKNLNVYFIILLLFFAAVCIYMIYMNNHKNFDLNEGVRIKDEVFKLKSELNTLEYSLDNLLAADKKLLIRLDYYRKVLKLDENAALLTIKDNLASIQGIKNRIVKLGLWKKEIEERESKIKSDVDKMMALFMKLGVEYEKVSDVEDYTAYVKMLEAIASYLPAAFSLQYSIDNLDEARNDISKLTGEIYEDSTILIMLDRYIEECIKNEQILKLNEEQEILKGSLERILMSERVRKGLYNYKHIKAEDKAPLLRFIDIYESYSGIEEINLEYEKVKVKKELLNHKLEELLKDGEKFKNEIEDILVSDRIKNSERVIDNARGGMRPIAEKYAVNSAAAFILERVYKNFMDKTQASFLEGSSELLRSITGSEYLDILPPLKVQSVDFRTKLTDGHVFESSDYLSRATREQLFLSVRINRIRQNENSLPVVIDDSFVNFDSVHIKRTLDIIGELSKTNQVFILTCHPYMVEYASALKSEVQYWKLDNGRLFNESKESLLNFLSFH